MADTSLPYPGARINKPSPTKAANAPEKVEVETPSAKAMFDSDELFPADMDSARASREALFWGFAKLFGP